MDELRDVSIHHTSLKIVSDITSMKSYDESIFKTVQKLVCSPEVQKIDMKRTLEHAIKANGLETEIRNMVFYLLRTLTKTDPKTPVLCNDSLSFLRRAGILWERRVRKSLNSMCTELDVTLQGQLRSSSEREEFLNKWEELSNYQIDLGNYRPVYAPKDLLEVLLSLNGPTRHEDDIYPKWEFSHITLPVKSLNELKTQFRDLLRPPHTNWHVQCKKMLSQRHAPLCQLMLKKGQTPKPLRGELWSYVLGSQNETNNLSYWGKLKYAVLMTDLIVDKLVFKDIQLTATNDDQYFVFEDILYQVMLCFSRDIEINQSIQSDIGIASKSKQYEGPPCGIVPFHGICMFAAPFCYIFNSPEQLYFTFRSFYIRYCHRLTTINMHPQGIVSLCLLFEKLLQTHEPQLWSHFRQLQIQPVRIVFKWLIRAFSGHLPPEELLILWDLILGYDSLEIVPFLAIIILSFRRESLMQINTMENIEAVLADLSSIKVLPLIQLTLSLKA